MSIITQDALKAISEQLSPTARLNLAAIDQRFFDASIKWHDVKTIVFDDDDVTMAGANFVHTYENVAFRKVGTDGNRTHHETDAKETALKLCPGLKKLIIQAKLSDFDAVMLNRLSLKLTKLYISTENLSLVNFPKFDKLRTLHLVYNCAKELKVVEVVETRVLKAVFPPTLRRVCLTGIYLTESLLTHLSSLPNLICLDTIGCLVDSRVGAKYVPLFESFPVLEELSLPPSLFSFSVKAKTPEISLKLLKVTKIGIYMDQFDDDLFYTQTRHFLPRNLNCLVVFGNYMPLKRWKLLNSIKNFVILFGPNTSLASCPQANLTNVKLLSHLVRGPPYIAPEYNPNFLRNHDVTIGNLNWQFSLIEWKDNNSCKNEVLALRTRMNALDDEDVVFEGLRIPAPVIAERFGQMRDRQRLMPVSPNAFQEFDRIIPPPPHLRHLPIVPPPVRHGGGHAFRPLVPARHVGRRSRSGPRRRRQSAPASITTATQMTVPRQSDSMRTNPPSPPTIVPTLSGAVFNATLPNVSPIGATTASRIGGTSLSVSTATNGDRTSVMNRGFVATPDTSSVATMGSSESRRLSTASMNSEMTLQSTVTASPERLSQVGRQNTTPQPAHPTLPAAPTAQPSNPSENAPTGN